MTENYNYRMHAEAEQRSFENANGLRPSGGNYNYGNYARSYFPGGGVDASINLGHGSRVNVGAPLGALIGLVAGHHDRGDDYRDYPPPRPYYREEPRPYYREEQRPYYRDEPRYDDPAPRQPAPRGTGAAIRTENDLADNGDLQRPQTQPGTRSPAANPGVGGAAPTTAAPAAPPAETPALPETPAPATAAPAELTQTQLNQQAQLYLERMGLSTGGKNHKVGTTMAADESGAADRLDGINGPKTQQALKDAGLDPSKPITAETITALKAAAEAKTHAAVIATHPETPAPAVANPAVAAPTADPRGTVEVKDSPERHAYLQAVAKANNSVVTDQQAIVRIEGMLSGENRAVVSDGKLSVQELITASNAAHENGRTSTPEVEAARTALLAKEGAVKDASGHYALPTQTAAAAPAAPAPAAQGDDIIVRTQLQPEHALYTVPAVTTLPKIEPVSLTLPTAEALTIVPAVKLDTGLATPGATALGGTTRTTYTPPADMFGGSAFGNTETPAAKTETTPAPAASKSEAPVLLASNDVAHPEGPQSGLPNMKAGSVQKVSIGA